MTTKIIAIIALSVAAVACTSFLGKCADKGNSGDKGEDGVSSRKDTV